MKTGIHFVIEPLEFTPVKSGGFVSPNHYPFYVNVCLLSFDVSRMAGQAPESNKEKDTRGELTARRLHRLKIRNSSRAGIQTAEFS